MIVRAAAGPKPLLYGVVVDGPRSRAYLEDPAVKGVFSYRPGDELGGGRIATIRPDRVVISRPDGALELLLQDPAKPRLPDRPGDGPRFGYGYAVGAGPAVQLQSAPSEPHPVAPISLRALVAYLAGREAGFVTGASVTIDGGFTA
jgi:hypothetical protein